jgi:serine/threonine protein kinase
MWSLGIILYELLTSKHPFMRNDILKTATAITQEEHPPLPSSIKEENKKIVSMLL